MNSGGCGSASVCAACRSRTGPGRSAYVLLEIDNYRRLTGQPDEEPSGEELVKQLSMSEEDYVSYVNADFRPGFFGAKIPEL